MEDYAAKMLLKPDAALREYVTGYAQYREAAVLAAFDELRRRGQPAPEEAALRPALEAGAAAQRQLDEAAEAERQPAANRPGPPAVEGPELYSPLAIVLFSIPSLLAGGVLLGINLYRVGQKRAIGALVVFVVTYLLAGSALLSWATQQVGLHPMWSALLFNALAGLAYVFWFWPRYVGTASFRTRSVLAPILVCLLLGWGAQKLLPFFIRQQPREMRQQLEHMFPR